DGRPPVPARSGICGPEGEESDEEHFDDQQGDERAPCTSWGSALRLSLELRVEEWRWDDAVWPPDRRTCASGTPEWSRLPGGCSLASGAAASPGMPAAPAPACPPAG